jgi:hypothetical protein
MAEPRLSFWKRNGLSIVVLSLMLIFWGAQAYTGWLEHNEDLTESGARAIGFAAYLKSGHFASATFENWESEFLQMGLYVWLTSFLYQKGSAESKDPDKAGQEEADREPQPKPGSPWPVKRGGFWLALYKYSLSIALALLFLFSAFGHFEGSLRESNEEHLLKGKAVQTWQEYIRSSHYWFESFQNWQSEFLAVATIVILSIWLRQHGSPESKLVDARHSSTGNS